MLRLLGVLLLVGGAVAGLGYYLGWFNVKATNNGVDIRINQTKLQEDEEKAKQKVEELKKKAQPEN